MSWFKHNGNASFDSRMVALQEVLGYFGIGVYWTMVERIECWGDGIYPRKRLIQELAHTRTDKVKMAQVLDDFNLFVTLESGFVILKKGSYGVKSVSTSTPNESENNQNTVTNDIESTPQRARVYTEEDKTKTTTSSSTTNIKTLKNENIKKSLNYRASRTQSQACLNCRGAAENHSEAEILNSQSSMFNPQSLSDKASRFAAEMAADRGEWHEMVCMKSGYGTLLHKYWEQAVTQWHQHVISYSTDSDVYSLQRARYYFNSFVKLSTKTGQDLKALLEVMEARTTQSVTEAEALPPGAPPRPSPKAIWNPAKEEWCEFY
ncbi:MAG: hypothetical protein IJV36_08290 [Prevotella sp.]|nr:hypothetical protein [Prevotella sp.]